MIQQEELLVLRVLVEKQKEELVERIAFAIGCNRIIEAGIDDETKDETMIETFGFCFIRRMIFGIKKQNTVSVIWFIYWFM